MSEATCKPAIGCSKSRERRLVRSQRKCVQSTRTRGRSTVGRRLRSTWMVSIVEVSSREKRVCFGDDRRVKSFGELAENGCDEIDARAGLVLPAPEMREAQRGAELRELRALPARDIDGQLIASFGAREIVRCCQKIAPNSMQIGLADPLVAGLDDPC